MENHRDTENHRNRDTNAPLDRDTNAPLDRDIPLPLDYPDHLPLALRYVAHHLDRIADEAEGDSPLAGLAADVLVAVLLRHTTRERGVGIEFGDRAVLHTLERYLRKRRGMAVGQ